jgi:Ran GTPase-activating protein (RanGAP) involved in mRNA processing and transport
MAWGGNDKAVEKWIKRLEDNDPTFTELHILSFRIIPSDELARLFSTLGRNSTLQHLYCSGLPIDSHAMECLSEAMSINDTLLSINIGTSTFGSDLALFKSFCAGLAVNESLHKVDLDNKGLTAESVKILAESIKKNGIVSDLILSRNKLDNDSVETLMEILSQNPSSYLMLLDLSMNEINKYGTYAIAEYLKKPSKLCKLDLSDNPIGSGSITIIEALPENKNLRSLKLAGTLEEEENFNLDEPKNTSQKESVGDIVLKALTKIFPAKQLEELWLDGLEISDAGISSLASIIHDSGIYNLRMRRNNITDEGATELAKAMQQSGEYPICLEMGENAITVNGFVELLACPNLEVLGLFNNKINNLNTAEFKVCPNISSLDIGCNGLSTEDFSVICDALKEGFGPKLTILELGGNVNNTDEELEKWEAMAAAVQEARPNIDMTWKRMHAVDDREQ